VGRLFVFCAGASNPGYLPSSQQVKNLLINTPNAYSEKDLRNTRKLIQAANPVNVMLDSGGFQILMAEENGIILSHDPQKGLIWSKKELNISPEHVIQVASTLQPEIMVALDYPIRKITDPEEQKREFLKKLKYNVPWALQTVELKTQSPLEGTRLFLPVQCYSIRQFEWFYQQIGRATFDGLSMPIRNMDVKDLLLFLIRMYQLGINQVHLLGTTKAKVIVIAAYLAARGYFNWVSLDSQGWRMSSEFSKYLNFYDLTPLDIKKGVSYQVICQCPWCQYRTFPDIKNMPYTDRSFFLSRHNYWVIEKFAKDVFQNSSNLGVLRNFLKERLQKKGSVDSLIQGLSLFESLKNNDIFHIEKSFQYLLK